MTPHRSLRPCGDPRPGHQHRRGRRLRPGRLWPAAALALLAGCAALAGCGAGSHSSASASPSAMSDAQVLAIGRQYAQCLRSHGLTDFPDPVYQNGHLGMAPNPSAAPNSDPKERMRDNPAAVQACQSILDRLPASIRHGQDHTPSPQEMQAFRQYAQCMRQNGITDWPDPLPNGDFPLSTPLQQEVGSKSSQRILTAQNACHHFLDDGKSPGTGGK